jgi:poly-beta-1,6-N-acetyl-D-glucosamine synthase
MFNILFFFFLLLIIYVYFGYPFFIFIIGSFKSNRINQDKKYRPYVSLIIAAYNEELKIEEKLKNSLELDYPIDKLEIIVFSDGSTDNTNEIIRGYTSRGIKLIELRTRQGKTAGQNIAVEQAKGEIIVFSDANALYRKNAIKKLVRNFSDGSVGGVCGELVYSNEHRNPIGEAENVYWNYEKFLKKNENNFYTILGANGSIYAVRKKIYVPLAENVISDFIEPLKILKQGYRFIYEPYALSFEQSTSDYKQEYKRKKRIVNRSFYSLLKHREFLNPLKYPLLSFQLISHKIFRWMVLPILLLLYICNLFLLGEPVFQLFFIGQCVFYLIALVGFIFEKIGISYIIFYTPFYFCLVNFASMKGIFEYIIKRKTIVAWEPIRK